MTTLRDILAAVDPIAPSQSGGEIYEQFQSQPELMVLAVVDEASRPIGLVERGAFMLKMGSQYGRALYGGRPIRLVMEQDPLIVDETAAVAEFAETALAGRASDLLRGFIVVKAGVYRGVGTILSLMQAITAESRRRMSELSELTQTLTRAEAQAHGAHQLLSEALNAISEGVAIFDEHDRIVLWNSKFSAYHRESAASLASGAPFETILRQGLAHGQYAQAIGREKAWLAERMRRRAQCRHRTVEEQSLADGRDIRVEDTRLGGGGLISVSVDITEIKKREASFRLLFEDNPVPLAVFDQDTSAFLAVNSAAVRRYGYGREQFVGLRALDLLSPEQRSGAALRAVRRSLLDAASAPTRQTHVTADGQRLDVLPYFRPLTYAGVAATLVAAVDVTPQLAAERDLKAALSAAEAANRAKGEFLANMSHEIRTPLNGVLGVASVLTSTTLDAEQRDMLEIIATSAKTLQALLGDVLDLSRIEAGQLSLQPEVVTPRAFVAPLGALFAAAAKEKGLGFTLDVEGDVDQPMIADATRLAQIITNLCSNAVKFTESGEVRLILTAESLPSGQNLRFEVRDTGIGLSAETASRLFQRFSQADGSITRRFGGTGLGPNISQALARMMGGEIVVRSVEGRGSTFALQLLFQRAEPPEQAPVIVSPSSPASDAPLRVLLVEDHPVNRKVVDLIIGEMCQLTMAENGEEGLVLAAAQGFDLILMDMQMPVMDGLAATRAIRELGGEPGAVPIIMLTANALREHVEAAVAAGVDDHLTKPFTAEVLLEAMARGLEIGRARLEELGESRRVERVEGAVGGLTVGSSQACAA